MKKIECKGECIIDRPSCFKKLFDETNFSKSEKNDLHIYILQLENLSSNNLIALEKMKQDHEWNKIHFAYGA